MRKSSVRVGYDPMRLGYVVYFVEDSVVSPQKKRVAQVLPNGTLHYDEYDIGEIVEPTLVLDEELMRDLVTAINGETHIKPEKVATIEGTLAAQTEHINDLRNIINYFIKE